MELLADEITDRFGTPPPPVRSLLALADVRTLASTLKILKISAGPDAIALTLEPDIDPRRAFAGRLENLDREIEIKNGRLLFRQSLPTHEERLAFVADLLNQLE